MTRIVLFAIVGGVLAACGGHKSQPVDDTLPDPPHNDSGAAGPPRTAIEVRRDAACEALGPKLTECAIADARRTMSPEELARLDPEQVAPVHTREFIKACEAQVLSSRQVRVYEVCLAQETECDPLIACLDHAKAGAE